MSRPGLKICGVTRVEDVQACRAAGVDAVGINFWSGSRRAVTEAEAAALVAAAREASTHAPVRVVGVFVDHSPAAVAALHERLGLDFIQPHGDAPAHAFAQLHIPWIWVVRGTPSLASLTVPAPAPAWALLDALVEGYGGEGRRTDWGWAARAVEALAPLPVWLAGGIDPGNAEAALTSVRPAGLDVATGAERPGGARGTKDATRVAHLAAICQNAVP